MFMLIMVFIQKSLVYHIFILDLYFHLFLWNLELTNKFYSKIVDILRFMWYEPPMLYYLRKIVFN